MLIKNTKENIQEKEYDFPYHWIPHQNNSQWEIFRYLFWGYEYLANLQVITEIVLSYQPKSVLDFGCGDGRLIYELNHKGINNIIGLDLSKRALDFAKAFHINHKNIQFVNSLQDASNKCFDAIIAMEVLEHIALDQIKSVLLDLHKIIDKNGVFIISVPTKNIPVNRKHYRHFDQDELEKDIQDIFIIDKIKYIHKQCFLEKILRKLLVNRFFITTWSPFLNLIENLYKKYIMEANEKNGSHLIAILRKIN